MKTLFAAALQSCGLSQREAAAFLDVSIDNVRSWSTGRRTPPAGVMLELWELNDRQQEAADEAYQAWREAKQPKEIEIGVATDDHEAESLGWPCVTAHMMVAERLWQMILPEEARVIVVPRGSTVTSAAAADTHEKK